MLRSLSCLVLSRLVSRLVLCFQGEAEWITECEGHSETGSQLAASTAKVGAEQRNRKRWREEDNKL